MRVLMRDSRRSFMTTPPEVTPTGSPFRWIWPTSGRSSQLMQRSRVDLPEPEGPSTQTVSPLPTWKLTSDSTSLSPKLLETPTTLSTGFELVTVSVLAAGVGELAQHVHARLDDQAKSPIEHHRRDEGREGNVVARLDGTGGMGQFRQGDDGQEGAVLDDLDQLVADYRTGRQHEWRQDDAAEQAELGKAEGDAGLDLVARQRHPGAAQDLGHVGGVVDREREQACAPVVEIDADRREAVIDDVGEEQERNAAHAVDEGARRARYGGLFRHQGGRQHETQQESADHRHQRQDRGIGQAVQKQTAFGPDDAEIADHAAASAATCRRSIQRCKETRPKTIGA